MTFTDIQLAPHIGVRRFGESLCLINQERREAWVWNPVSAHLWDLLTRGGDKDRLSASLQRLYHLKPEKADHDVTEFLRELWRLGFITLDRREPRSDEVAVHRSAHNITGHMHSKAYDAGMLFRAWIDLLVPCNLRCRHCYLDFSQKEIVPFVDLVRWFDQLRDHGCPDITLTGGEVFLRKDIIDIIHAADERGFLFDMFTNGNLVDEPMADRLADFRITAVQVSLYGVTDKVHELVTRKPGTFDKSVRTIKLLRERRIPVRIAFHVQADNYNDAFALPAFAESLDADYDFDTKLVPNRNGSLEPLSFGITVEQQAMLHREGLIEKAYSLVCPAARSKIRITAAGDVYPCQLINTVSIGNMYTQSLDEIWGSPLRSKVRQEILDYTPHRCTKCSHTSDCLPCAAMRGFNQTSDHLSAPVSEACLLTASRLLADDLLLPEHIQSTDCFSNAMKSPSDLVQIRAF